jgi:hypothetical protein
MARVLQHPSVVEAAANVMVAGIDAAMAQPDLIQRVANMTKSATHGENSDGAREIGEEFPHIAAQFLGGAFSALKGHSNHNKNKSQEENKVQDDVVDSDVESMAGDEETKKEK